MTDTNIMEFLDTVMPQIMPFITFGVMIAAIIWAIRFSKNEKIVLEKSQRIQTLLTLNETIKFCTIQSRYTNHHSCNTKRQLDHLSMDEYLTSLIFTNEVFYKNIIVSISFNRDTYNRYITQTQAIQSNMTEDYCKSFGFTMTKFLKYEERLFKKQMLPRPQCDVVIHCKATYTSPQGRNHYYKEKHYSYDELKSIYNDAMKVKAQQQTRQYQIRLERAKMTDSLRYDILKRDNFRCQICGSTQQDGVKLHVDHIVPVSKGGKTEPSNLQTLCDRCNMGKSNKM